MSNGNVIGVKTLIKSAFMPNECYNERCHEFSLTNNETSSSIASVDRKLFKKYSRSLNSRMDLSQIDTYVPRGTYEQIDK
jgi:hypothetical protein